MSVGAVALLLGGGGFSKTEPVYAVMIRIEDQELEVLCGTNEHWIRKLLNAIAMGIVNHQRLTDRDGAVVEA